MSISQARSKVFIVFAGPDHVLQAIEQTEANLGQPLYKIIGSRAGFDGVHETIARPTAVEAMRAALPYINSDRAHIGMKPARLPEPVVTARPQELVAAQPQEPKGWVIPILRPEMVVPKG